MYKRLTLRVEDSHLVVVTEDMITWSEGEDKLEVAKNLTAVKQLFIMEKY